MIIAIVIFALSSALIWRFKLLRVNGLAPWMTVLAFALKCAAGIALWYMYSHMIDIDRRDADIFKYFDDGLVMQSAFNESAGTYLQLILDKDGADLNSYYDSMYNWDRSYALIQLNDNRTMIRLHSLMAFVSGGDILTHIVFFNLLAFIGLVFLFKGFGEFYNVKGWVFIVACILPPSLLFWGSGLLKESVVLLPLGLSFYGASALYRGHGGKMFLLAGLVLFSFIKPYVLLSLFPALLYLIARHFTGWKPLISALTVGISCVIVLALSGLSAKYDVIGILALKQKDFVNVALMSDAGSLVDIPKIKGLFSFLLNSPEAIFRTFARPGLWEVRSGMDGLAAIENSGYILLVLCAFIFRKKNFNVDLLMTCLIFLIGMGILIGSVTPVLGAVVRYKVPALPFLMMAVLHMIDFNKLKSLFR
jgi:hypothetical protein